jgi:hypothetical protein
VKPQDRHLTGITAHLSRLPHAPKTSDNEDIPFTKTCTA